MALARKTTFGNLRHNDLVSLSNGNTCVDLFICPNPVHQVSRRPKGCTLALLWTDGLRAEGTCIVGEVDAYVSRLNILRPLAADSLFWRQARSWCHSYKPGVPGELTHGVYDRLFRPCSIRRLSGEPCGVQRVGAAEKEMRPSAEQRRS